MQLFASIPPSRLATVGNALLMMSVVGLTAATLLLITSAGFVKKDIVYRLDPTALRIEVNYGPVDLGRVIPRSAILEARALDGSGGQRRVMGTGLPGFCHGAWEVTGLGAAWAATDCGNDLVLLRLAEGNVIISPFDPEQYVADLGLADATTIERLPPSGGLGAWVPALVLVLLSPLVGLVFWARRGLSYRIEAGALIVPAHFAPVRVRLAGATARRTPLSGAMRLGGTGLPGMLYLGNFWGCGRMLHCAATNLKQGWLIVGDRAVYLSPADAEAFAAALQEHGVVVEPG